MLLLQKRAGAKKPVAASKAIGYQWSLAIMGLLMGLVQVAQAVPAQTPLFVTTPVVPVMMLTMDKDHQLYFKAYDDYSDFTDSNPFLPNSTTPNPKLGTGGPDGQADISYVHKYLYYGYFDSKKCYDYNITTQRFEPAAPANAENYCSLKWSGNFLNWATMTRMDVVRKVLYGGLRSTDQGGGANEITVLERAFLPNDAHSFAKYYNGADINKLIPFTVPADLKNTKDTGITLCNTTSITTVADKASNMSQSSLALNAPPLFRLVKGDYRFWASNERWQCLWGANGGTDDQRVNYKGFNGNNSGATGIKADDYAPFGSTTPSKLSVNNLPVKGEYNVRVRVCVKGMEEGNCQQYPSSTYANKPIGLLQKYGEIGLLNFGLMTGSYGRSKSGGVLRKNAGNMLDEINTTTYGTFKAPPASVKNVAVTNPLDGRIINTLNKLRLFGYNFAAGHYWDPDSGGDNCGFHLASFKDTDTGSGCSNWGNPQSEIYYEALRYLSGAKPTSGFSRTTNLDSNYITGLTQVPWVKPITNANYCAPLSILQFSGASSSYDVGADGQYDDTGDLALPGAGVIDINTYTDEVGSWENIIGSKRFVGRILGASIDGNSQLCTAKTVNKLSNVSGICPESPRVEGGYVMVGLARYARKTGIPLNGVVPAKRGTVRTFSVALAPAIPKVEVPVPNSLTKQKIIIQPACRNNSDGNNGVTNCAIVDFKVLEQKTYTREQADSGFPAKGFPAGYGSEGRLYVNWEDGEQGGDYDQDMWGIISYFVTSTNVYIKTQVFSKSSTQKLGFGYILSGTGTATVSTDGFHVHSGINFYEDGKLCKGGYGTSGSLVCTCIAEINDLTAPCSTILAEARTQTYNVAPSTGSDASFLESPLYYAAKWGGYDKEFAAANTAGLDSAIANRKPTDSFFFANNPEKLVLDLEAAFTEITDQVGVASGVATNNFVLESGSYIFRSEFNTSDWSGTVRAFEVDENGAFKKDPNTDKLVQITTSDTNKIPDHGARNVYTYKPASGIIPASLIKFEWGLLTPDQQKALAIPAASADANASKRVDWIRGSPANEGVGAFRIRTTTKDNLPFRNVLGDLVNSSPVFVGPTDYHYDSYRPVDDTSYDTGSYRKYVNLKKSKTPNKTPRIFVGGNDGMVHAFDVASKETMLKEMYAYIPSSVYPKLANLTRPDYGKNNNPHQFLVDGPIATSDVYIDGHWRTIVVGTLGAGGKGIYALEVMNDFDGSKGENGGVTDSQPKLLFELTATTHPQLGHVLGTPVIAPMANGRWAVVFGNGDSSGSNSRLFVVDIAAPMSTHTRVINTEPNAAAPTTTGLSAPALMPNARGQAIAAYAGDLQGNLWHFDLSNTSAAQWKMDYLLFKATATTGEAQPIFAAPALGINTVPAKNNKVMVYFGTGKYYDSVDLQNSSQPRHSLYAIADMGEQVLRSALLKKTYVAATDAKGPTRTLSKDNPKWETQHGWYLDLGVAASDQGERITTTPILVEDKLIFATIIPSTNVCDMSGRNWIMEVPAVGNKFVGQPALERNTQRAGLILGNLIITKTDPKGSVAKPADGPGANLGGSTTDALTAPINDALDLAPALVGRQSWRQVR